MSAIRPIVGLVDDDRSIRESLPDLLHEFGYSVRTFWSAKECLASAGLDDIAVLILDIAMPGMTGIELRAELKRRGIHVPVIFISASHEKLVYARATEGTTACLLKPFSATDLCDALRSALSIE
jgi:FixJ family two-component response regulator